MAKIRKGDNVKVMSGNDKGKHGKVLTVFPEAGRATVEGVNIKNKHARSTKQGQKGELVHKTMPVAIARLMIMCPTCGKPARIKYKLSDKEKTRICQKCGADL